jgi:hypothetical protein
MSQDSVPDALLPQSAALQVAEGEHVGPVVRRVVGMLAARANIAVAELDAAVSLSEALGAACSGRTPGARLGLQIETDGSRLSIKFGPLSAGEGAGAVADTREAVGVNGHAGALAGGLRTEAMSDGDYVVVEAGT